MDSEGDGYLEVFKSELKNDIYSRVNAVKRLTTIGLALGPQKVIDELIPFLTEVAEDESDEILCGIAEELAFFPQIINDPSLLPKLLPPLFTMTQADPQIVRDAAIRTLISIGEKLTTDDFRAHMAPHVAKLHASETFAHRISAAGLQPTVVAHADPADHPEIFEKIRALQDGELLVVKRAGAIAMGEVCGPLAPTCTPQLTEALKKLAVDEAELIRVEAVPACLAFARSGRAPTQAQALLETLAEDVAWRVRRAVIDCFVEWVGELGSVRSPATTLTLFFGLLDDPEPDVRLRAIAALPDVAAAVTEDLVVSKLTPRISALVSETNANVRLAAAPAAVRTARVVIRSAALFQPALTAVLRDSSPEVRLLGLTELVDVLSLPDAAPLAAKIKDDVCALAVDPSWRVRQLVVRLVPVLVARVGYPPFEQLISTLSLSWLTDGVAAIRLAAAAAVAALLPQVPSRWVTSKLVPRLNSMAASPRYLFRGALAATLLQLAPVADAALLSATLLPLALQLTDDPTANVRIAAATALGALNDDMATDDASKIAPALQKLAADPDIDVQRSAKRALGINAE